MKATTRSALFLLAVILAATVRAEDKPAEKPPLTEAEKQAIAELEQSGVSRMDAVKQVARARGMHKREVYKAVFGG